MTVYKQYVVAAVDGTMGVFEYMGSQISGFMQHYHCKNLCDWTTFSSVVAGSFGVVTLPNIAEFCSALWLFGRVLEMVTGKPVHELIKEARARFKAWTSTW